MVVGMIDQLFKVNHDLEFLVSIGPGFAESAMNLEIQKASALVLTNLNN